MSERKFVFLTAGIPGVVALDSDKNIVSSSGFPSRAEDILQKLEDIEEGEITPEVKEVLDSIGTDNIVTSIPLDLENFKVEVKDKVSANEYLRNNMREVSKEIGFAESDAEFNEILRDVQVKRTRQGVKSAVEKDKLMAQTVSALEDLRNVTNELSERLQEWYGLYYPELEVESNEKRAELIAKLGEREEFEGFDGSMGLDIDSRDVKILQEFAEEVNKAFKTRDRIKKYLDGVMPSVAPNLTKVIGAEMAAKLISLAGSLEDLAKMPSSKIQLLGAEKALFRHLKGGGKPPKYGIIYNHPYIQKTQEGKGGKVARAIASKLMMAARTDYYTDKFKGEEYKKELEKKIEGIRGES